LRQATGPSGPRSTRSDQVPASSVHLDTTGTFFFFPLVPHHLTRHSVALYHRDWLPKAIPRSIPLHPHSTLRSNQSITSRHCDVIVCVIQPPSFSSFFSACSTCTDQVPSAPSCFFPTSFSFFLPFSFLRPLRHSTSPPISSLVRSFLHPTSILIFFSVKSPGTFILSFRHAVNRIYLLQRRRQQQ